MTEADEIRAEVTALSDRAERLVTNMRLLKTQLDELATDYGNISPRLDNVEYMIAAAGKIMEEPIVAVQTALKRGNEWAQLL